MELYLSDEFFGLAFGSFTEWYIYVNCMNSHVVSACKPHYSYGPAELYDLQVINLIGWPRTGYKINGVQPYPYVTTSVSLTLILKQLLKKITTFDARFTLIRKQ